MVPKKVQKFVKLRFALAINKLQVAKILIKEKQYRDAVSRSYYAMFYAAKAVILLKNYKKRDPSTHKGVRILFSKYFIKTKLIENTFSKMLRAVEEARFDADYGEKVKIYKKNAKEALDLAKKFVEKMHKVSKTLL